MLKLLNKNYVLEFIKNKRNQNLTFDELESMLGISNLTMTIIRYTLESGQVWGQQLSNLDVVDMYLDGLTFAEIGSIKGVSQEAIRVTVNNTSRIDKKELKTTNRKKRDYMRNVILYDMAVNESELTSKEIAMRKSGYSKSVFNRVYRESINWKIKLNNEK